MTLREQNIEDRRRAKLYPRLKRRCTQLRAEVEALREQRDQLEAALQATERQLDRQDDTIAHLTAANRRQHRIIHGN